MSSPEIQGLSAPPLQCDQQRSVLLNPEAKLYSVSALNDWSEQFKRRRPLPEGQGADVTTTFDAVDTGERRRVGGYIARRVRTTVTVEPSPGANTPASTRETDGWYIDLPGLGCSDADTTAYLMLVKSSGPAGWGPSPLQNQGRVASRYAMRKRIVSHKQAGRSRQSRIDRAVRTSIGNGALRCSA